MLKLPLGRSPPWHPTQFLFKMGKTCSWNVGLAGAGSPARILAQSALRMKIEPRLAAENCRPIIVRLKAWIPGASVRAHGLSHAGPPHSIALRSPLLPGSFSAVFADIRRRRIPPPSPPVQLSPRPRTAPDERKRLPSSFGRFHRRRGGARPGSRKAAKAEKGARGGSHALEALSHCVWPPPQGSHRALAARRRGAFGPQALRGPNLQRVPHPRPPDELPGTSPGRHCPRPALFSGKVPGPRPGQALA